jgi:hypothetical protein
MTKLLKAALLGLLLAVMLLARVNAQTISYRTNVLIKLTFNLTEYEQAYLFLSTNGFGGPYAPSARTTRVVTSGIISAIAHDAQITGDLSNAKLYWRLSWTDPNEISRDFVLRRGTNDFLVGGDNSIFNYVLVSFPDSVSDVQATLTGTTNSTDYANCNVSLGTSQGSFALHGIATLKSASLSSGGHIIDRTPFPLSFTASVAGSGTRNTPGQYPYRVQLEWKGTVTGSGQKVEVTEVSP